MAPYLRTVKSFADVPITEDGVDTCAFLEASQGLVRLFDILGSSAFIVVQNDLKGNIDKVRARYNAKPDESKTLEKLVENEAKDPEAKKKRPATEALMWLLRGLSFTCKALVNAQANKSEELSTAFSNSYTVTLKSFHNFVVKGVFAVAMKACPYRKDFYAKLAADPDGGPAETDAEMNALLDKWLAALEGIVTRMETFYAKGDHGKGF